MICPPLLNTCDFFASRRIGENCPGCYCVSLIQIEVKTEATEMIQTWLKNGGSLGSKRMKDTAFSWGTRWTGKEQKSEKRS